MVLKQSAKDCLCFVDGSGNKFTVNHMGEHAVEKSSSEEVNGISQLHYFLVKQEFWQSSNRENLTICEEILQA